MPHDPADAQSRWEQSYLALLGLQASGLAAGHVLPAEVETSLEESIRLTAALAAPVAEIARQAAEFTERRLSGVLTEADREHARWLRARLAELVQIHHAHRERVLAVARRHGMPPSP